ncbi:TANK-binding kinase 1-binding protein 1-like isoform X1 [Lates japonicus]|uniref:TANK-binding kinase 1-binding protein 1-like isoform X1 n=1 Tax=Lates japonicus TaxID=270547 RepID=A0AAD3NCU2_LATJO|nr:TANK-binding kinase 1-binding protein 1-like isoform X1 [Lates japonicus]
MDLVGRGELGLLGGGEGLREDVGVPGISWSANRLPDDMYPASGLALAAASHDIKTRLASLERENSSIKRKLKHYEVKFPMISEFGEERILQKSKEREERLEEVIQAYEKIHLEKSNVQRDLDKMTTLAEQHVERICSLELALRQRETSIQKLSAQLRSKDAHQSQLHTSLDTAPTPQSGRPVDLGCSSREAELEGMTPKPEACQRGEGAEGWLQNCSRRVNLALAYTELTEELGRVRVWLQNRGPFYDTSHRRLVSDPSASEAPKADERPSIHSSQAQALLGETQGCQLNQTSAPNSGGPVRLASAHGAGGREGGGGGERGGAAV